MKKRNVLSGLVVIAVVLTSTGCAGKFGHAKFEDKMFSKFDEDKDGSVDKTEYLEVSSTRFERADDNGDSKVSKEESENTFIAKRFPSKMQKWFYANDINKDGYISTDEMKKSSKEEFLLQDTNGDSKLSKGEMSEYRKSERFKSIDRDNDGSISKDEYSKSKSKSIFN